MVFSYLIRKNTQSQYCQLSLVATLSHTCVGVWDAEKLGAQDTVHTVVRGKPKRGVIMDLKVSPLVRQGGIPPASHERRPSGPN